MNKTIAEPTVVLGEYRNIEVPVRTAEVTEEDIENAKKTLCRQNKTEMKGLDRPVENGDIVSIDYEGFVDGVAFEGGQGEGYDLEIGSHSFIDTFEEQLIGHKTGECVNVKVKFPQNYPVTEMSGREALFKVTIKEITGFEVPEFDISLVTTATGFDSVEDFLEDAKKNILSRKQDQLDMERENNILEQIIACSQITVPEEMIAAREEEMFDAYTRQLRSQGVEIAEYLGYLGMNKQEFMESMKPETENYIKSRAVLKAIAEAEGVTVSNEEFDKEVETVASQYNTTAQQVMEMMDEERRRLIMEDLLLQKTMKLLI